MHARLNELRNQVAAIDREIVAALARRSRFCRYARPGLPASAGQAADDPLGRRIRADYARLVVGEISNREACCRDEPACEDADRMLLEALLRRLRIVREIARAKGASQASDIRSLVEARNADGLERAITQPAVEAQVVARVMTMAGEQSADGMPGDFPERVAAVYRGWVIPLARRIQVERLLEGPL